MYDPCYSQKSMPTDHILSLLIAERDKLNRAIEALQGPAKRRGRPPKNPLAVTAPAKPPRQKSAAQIARDKAASARMKAYWRNGKKLRRRARLRSQIPFLL
jgi:hypothetical protein